MKWENFLQQNKNVFFVDITSLPRDIDAITSGENTDSSVQGMYYSGHVWKIFSQILGFIKTQIFTKKAIGPYIFKCDRIRV